MDFEVKSSLKSTKIMDSCTLNSGGESKSCTSVILGNTLKEENNVIQEADIGQMHSVFCARSGFFHCKWH